MCKHKKVLYAKVQDNGWSSGRYENPSSLSQKAQLRRQAYKKRVQECCDLGVILKIQWAQTQNEELPVYLRKSILLEASLSFRPPATGTGFRWSQTTSSTANQSFLTIKLHVGVKNVSIVKHQEVLSVHRTSWKMGTLAFKWWMTTKQSTVEEINTLARIM